MSTTNTRTSWRRANTLAYQIAANLRPGCGRIEAAGSIRRKAESVGDIEFVIVPKYGTLFGEAKPGTSLLDVELDRLIELGKLTPGERNGERWKQLVLTSSGIKLDLFIVTPSTWGVMMAIRTGPADFSKAIVTEQHRGGRLMDGFAVAEGKVWTRTNQPTTKHVGRAEIAVDPTPIEFADEREFFNLAGGYYEPHERHVGQPIINPASKR